MNTIDKAKQQAAIEAHLAASWKVWLKTPEAQECLLLPVVSKKILENRLWYAFMKGAADALKLNQQ